MNKIYNKFDDVLTEQYQDEVRLKLARLMKDRPMSVAIYAGGIGVASNSLAKFLRGHVVSYVVITKITNYIEDN